MYCTSMGPTVTVLRYYLNQDSFDDPQYNATGIPQVQRNPYGWTKIANVIAVNNPPVRPAPASLLHVHLLESNWCPFYFGPQPIGFSYCSGGSGPNTGPAGDGYSCGPWNDSSVAKANHNFLKTLFTKDFPE